MTVLCTMTQDLTQHDLLNEALSLLMHIAPAGWIEMVVDFYVDGGQSCLLKSYTIEREGVVKEESLGSVQHLDYWLRQLQQHLAQADRRPFTRCRIHVTADGQYTVSYEYGEIDWAALLVPDWSILPVRGGNHAVGQG